MDRKNKFRIEKMTGMNLRCGNRSEKSHSDINIVVLKTLTRWGSLKTFSNVGHVSDHSLDTITAAFDLIASKH